MKTVYLDYSATTPLDPRSFDAMRPFFLEKFGNASSIHRVGQEARAALDNSRDKIAQLLAVDAGEIYFVSGGTEANNFALKCIAWRMREDGKTHIITSKSEHHAILDTCEYLEHTGFQVSYIDVDDYGMVEPEEIGKRVRSTTGLITTMHSNNEIGTINPISEIAAIAHEHNVIFHSDAVQSFGKIPLRVPDLQVDSLSLSAHKIYGPKGIGVLYVRKGIEIERLMHGGGQERGRRAGTENIPLIVGFATSAELIISEMESEQGRISELRNKMKSMLQQKNSFIIFNGHPTHVLPNILNISFDSRKIDIDGEALLFNLDLAGIAVASGSACTSGSMTPSHVLSAMGRDLKTAKASIRFSLGRATTEEDLDYTVNTLEGIINRIGKVIV
ncbi:MAG TPA: cysteine desulfurase family protein [Bacteroidota bacterium]|nr:cysteine desulfurase family protein [Bacteroidota bacterium]